MGLYTKDTGMSMTEYAVADQGGGVGTLEVVHQDCAQFLGVMLIHLGLRSQLTNYGFQFNKIPLYCDNKSAIALCCNNVQHSRAKHIDVRYDFIKEHVEIGIVETLLCSDGISQLDDIFTITLQEKDSNS
ncbi:hypothetical protein Tco_1391739 [Tanacetum coccineum]